MIESSAADRARSEETALLAATLVAAGMIAQQVASKTARDALFLATFPVQRLPDIVLAAAFLSIVLILPMTRLLVRIGPIQLVRTAFVTSAVLLAIEWLLCRVSLRAGTLLLYLQVAAIGPAIVSGFWSLITERFDPRTARRRMSRLVAGGTLGGLLGGFLAERVGSIFGAVNILPILALIHLLCALGVSRALSDKSQPSRIAGSDASAGVSNDASHGSGEAWSGVRSLVRRGYLRHLAILVVLGALAAGLIDYALKLRAVEAYANQEDQLVRFFALFYSAAALLTLIVQTTLSPWLLEHWGPSRTAGLLPATVGLGSIAAVFAPALPLASFVRGAESVLRSSVYRSGYELLYAPVDPVEKRRSKAWIDIGCDRLGDGLGAIVVKGLNLLPAQLPLIGFFGLAAVASLVSLRMISRLSRGYVKTLQKSLLQRAEALDLTRSTETLSRSTLLQTFAALDRRELLAQINLRGEVAASNPSFTPAPVLNDEISEQVLALRSGNIETVRSVLSQDPVDPSLAGHLIPLLAWDDVCDEVIRALRLVAPRAVVMLVDALLDPSQEFAVRRRIPRVMAVVGDARATAGLRGGLADKRFEVRFQCGRALAIIHRRHPEIPVDRPAILAAVLRELEVDRPIWESRRLLDQRFEDPDDSDSSIVDRLLRDRSNKSLEHVFTLLSLVLQAEPLRVAFRGLHTGDPGLRGTALEYLESVLPTGVRDKLWPFLEIDRLRTAPSPRSSQEVLDQLMRSHDSIAIQLRRHDVDSNNGSEA